MITMTYDLPAGKVCHRPTAIRTHAVKPIPLTMKNSDVIPEPGISLHPTHAEIKPNVNG